MAARLLSIGHTELDLPLADTPASRFLTWLMAGLVYLAVLAFAVAAGADARVRHGALQPQLLTVGLPPAMDGAAGEQEAAGLVERLRGYPGVAYASVVAREEVERLVGAVIGRRGGQPMPRLIDVSFNPGTAPDPAVLRAALDPFAQGVSVEDASPEGTDEEGARSLRLLAGTAGLAVLLGVCVTVAIVTRMSLDLHGETVDLLRLMGAPDGYVARQFEQHALASGLRGGLVGFALGLLTVFAFVLVQVQAPRLGLPALALRPFDWVALGCVPLVSALLTTLIGRVTAAVGLARLR